MIFELVRQFAVAVAPVERLGHYEILKSTIQEWFVTTPHTFCWYSTVAEVCADQM
jgi:hypothetical protein